MTENRKRNYHFFSLNISVILTKPDTLGLVLLLLLFVFGLNCRKWPSLSSKIYTLVSEENSVLFINLLDHVSCSNLSKHIELSNHSVVISLLYEADRLYYNLRSVR